MNSGEVIQERYRLEGPLGKGGMAEVWRARDLRLERPVAIKLMAQQFTADPEFLVRFFSEAQSVARISHPNVVPVLDFGAFEERPYIVMPFIPGGSLARLTGRPLNPSGASKLVAHAALGAGAAHQLGIIHRDIKPANILLGDDEDALLTDFGISASAVSEKLTATGAAIGSPHYISPEQASGETAREQSDVYALGVVLYELLTGHRPFDGDNATAIAIAHVEQSPQPPTAHVPDLDPALESIVLRCLEKDPERRFPDGNALAAALAPELRAALVAVSEGRGDETVVLAAADASGDGAARGAAAPGAAGATVISHTEDDPGARAAYHQDGLWDRRQRQLVAGLIAVAAFVLLGGALWMFLNSRDAGDTADDLGGRRSRPRAETPRQDVVIDTPDSDEVVVPEDPDPGQVPDDDPAPPADDNVNVPPLREEPPPNRVPAGDGGFAPGEPAATQAPPEGFSPEPATT